MGSILGSIKEQLGLGADAEGFDPELILHINAVLAEFHELGVGPETGYAITGPSQTWENFLGGEPRYNMAPQLMYLKVKMAFDPPQVGYVLTSFEKLIEKNEWRLNLARESIIHPVPDENAPHESPQTVYDGGEI